jgi:hypothetical protein
MFLMYVSTTLVAGVSMARTPLGCNISVYTESKSVPLLFLECVLFIFGYCVLVIMSVASELGMLVYVISMSNEHNVVLFYLYVYRLVISCMM